MHILAAIATIGLTALFWAMRVRSAAFLIGDLVDMGERAMGAFRRARFRARAETHPIEAIDDPALAAGALTVAFLAQGASLNQDARRAHLQALQTRLGLCLSEAEEIQVLGDWFIRESSTAADASLHIARRLKRLSGGAALDPALMVISDIAGLSGGLTDGQRQTLARIRRIFDR